MIGAKSLSPKCTTYPNWPSPHQRQIVCFSKINKPNRLTQCFTQFKHLGKKRFAPGIAISLNFDGYIIMQIRFKMNLNSGRFELGSTTFGLLFPLHPPSQNWSQNKHFSEADGDKPDTRFLLFGNEQLRELKHEMEVNCFPF